MIDLQSTLKDIIRINTDQNIPYTWACASASKHPRTPSYYLL